MVLLDMDGVLADYEAGCARVLTAMGANPASVPRSGWSFAADVEARLGAGAALEFADLTSRPGFFAGLDPMPGAPLAVERMLDAGWTLVVCTSPRLSARTCASEKLDWLSQHTPGVSRSFTITKDKSLVRGHVLVDDKPNAGGALTPTWTQMLFGTAPGHHGPYRMGSWGELQNLFDLVAAAAAREV